MARRSAPPLPPLLLVVVLVLLPLSERSCVAFTTPATELTGATDTSLPADSLVRLLETTISRAVRASVGEATSELDGRLAGFQTQLTQLAVTLAGLQDQQQAQNATIQRQLQAIESSVLTVQSRLESQLEGVQTQQDSKLDSQLVTTLSETSSRQTPPRDCSDLPAGTASGVHQLLLPNLDQVAAFCDMETDGGGWTVFQRRQDSPPPQDFFRDWEAYKHGFGPLDEEFWWGLENLFLVTSLLPGRRYELRIDMGDFEGEKRFALYQDFRISSEADGYRLHVTNYSGDAGDSLLYHNGMAFSTRDKDQDQAVSHCAQEHEGAWWYKNCRQSNLNGLYLSGSFTLLRSKGINWNAWRGYNYSLKSVEMKMRPAKRAS